MTKWVKVKANRSKKPEHRQPQDYASVGEYHEDYMARQPVVRQKTAYLDHARLKKQR